MVFLFERNDAFLGPGGLQGQLQTSYDLVRVLRHQLLVYPQQRLALRPVGNDHIRFGGQFNVGGKSGAAGPDYAG